MGLPTDVNIDTFDNFRNDTIGRGFDVDGQHGFQCWDYGATLWGLTGDYAYPYLSTGGIGYAYGIWSDRELNAIPDFTLITRKEDIKRGDMVILDKGRFSGDVSGHNAFADEDYNGTDTMQLLGQNQENPSPIVGHVVTSNQMSISKFLGAFRFNKWEEPTPSIEKRKFPFYLLPSIRNR